MDKTSLLFNQQVAAKIQYMLVPAATHKALKAAPVFNLIAAVPTKMIIQRAWFALDKNADVEKKIRTLIAVGNPEETAALFAAIKQSDLKTLLKDEKPPVDPQILKDILNSSSGTIHLKFAEHMPHTAVAEALTAAIPFRKLSSVLERLSRQLTNDNRGGLLQVDVSYTSGTDFTNAKPL